MNFRPIGASRLTRKALLLCSLAALCTTLSLRGLAQDGTYPQGSFIQATDGFLYGVAYNGGTANDGLIYRMDTSGNITILHSFVGSDGIYPPGSIMQAYDIQNGVYTENFYGTTNYGGTYNKGTIYHMDLAGNVHSLFSLNTNDGINPLCALIQGMDGNLWGTASSKDILTTNKGSVFNITPYGGGSSTFTKKHMFVTGEGSSPQSPLVQDGTGMFYGTTKYGGANDLGAIYQMDQFGKVWTLYSCTNADGINPGGQLTLGPDGSYYGVCASGGTSNHGTVFKFTPTMIGKTPSCNLTVIHKFVYSDGHGPAGVVVFGTDGYLYGTTVGGGANGIGCVYRMNPANGATTVLLSFNTTNGKYGSGLLQGRDGYLYGTAREGGLYTKGVAFRMDYSGNQAIIHHFGAPVISNLSFSPTSITAPATSTGTVTLTGAAATGEQVFLTTDNPDVINIPAMVSVSGVSSATFTAAPAGRVGTYTATVYATYGGFTKSATITVTCGSGGGGGGGGSNFLYQVVDIPETKSISNLELTDIRFPKQMRVDWLYGPYVGSTPTYTVERRLNGSTAASWTVTDMYKVDAFDFTPDTAYQYRVKVASDIENWGLPAPPPGADPATIAHLHYVDNSPWVTIDVTPKQAVATDNQTADSRWDLRWSTYRFLDFQFSSGTYRGGLFVGFPNGSIDKARVARSFMKFQIPDLAGANTWFAGTVNAYFTRMLASGTMTVGCQETSNLWGWGDLKWTTAPVVDPTAASRRKSLTYSGSPINDWVTWTFPGEVATAASRNGKFAVALTSTAETTPGWAYFAKKEFDSAHPPTVLYAVGAPAGLLNLTIDPNPIVGGKTGTGIVTVSGLAPSGGYRVTFKSYNPAVLKIQGGVTILSGMNSGRIRITTSAVSSNTDVDVEATLQTNPVVRKTFKVTVTP